MIFIRYRHGLRASELVNLCVSDLDLATGNKGCDLRLIQDYLGHKQIQNTVRNCAESGKVFGALATAAR